MKKSHQLILCSLVLYAAMASSAVFAEGRSGSNAESDRRAARTTEQARKDEVIDTKSVAGNDSKMSTQGLKRAQKAEANKKLLEKQRAENRAREEARAKNKDKCKGCPEGGVYDQSSLFNK